MSIVRGLFIVSLLCATALSGVERTWYIAPAEVAVIGKMSDAEVTIIGDGTRITGTISVERQVFGLSDRTQRIKYELACEDCAVNVPSVKEFVRDSFGLRSYWFLTKKTGSEGGIYTGAVGHGWRPLDHYTVEEIINVLTQRDE